MFELGLILQEMIKMPNNNGIVTCINHPNQAMVKNDGFSAITSLKKEDENITFEPASGIPVVTYYCPTCGYIENYAAQLTQDWS